MPRLKNNVAIITGAGRGIGFAAAQAFVREGAKVVMAEIDEELGRSAEHQLRAAGGEATFVRTDCACSADVQLAEETWARILAINLNSVFLCGKYALPLMIRKRSHAWRCSSPFPRPELMKT